MLDIDIQSRSLRCRWFEPAVMQCFYLPSQKCDDIIVLHLGFLNYMQYQIVVSFRGLENITYDFKVKFVVSEKHLNIFLLPRYCFFLLLLLFLSLTAFFSLFSGKCTIPPSHKWKSGSGLSSWCWPLLLRWEHGSILNVSSSLWPETKRDYDDYLLMLTTNSILFVCVSVSLLIRWGNSPWGTGA